MEVEISFKSLLKTLTKHLWVIIVIALVAALLAALYTNFLVTPVYSATATCRILVDDLNATKGGNLTTTLNILSTYAKSITSDDVMNNVSARLQLPMYTPEYLRKIVSINFEAGSIILQISASDTNPENARLIVTTICESTAVCNDDLATLTVIQAAKTPSAPSSPSLVKNVALAVLLALVLSYGIFFVIDLYNNEITDEDELAAALSVPVIGAIPLIETLVNDKKNAEGEAKTNV